MSDSFLPDRRRTQINDKLEQRVLDAVIDGHRSCYPRSASKGDVFVVLPDEIPEHEVERRLTKLATRGMIVVGDSFRDGVSATAAGLIPVV